MHGAQQFGSRLRAFRRAPEYTGLWRVRIVQRREGLSMGDGHSCPRRVATSERYTTFRRREAP